MPKPTRRPSLTAAATILVGGLLVGTAAPAQAQTAASGTASGFGAAVTIGGEPAIVEPTAAVETAPGDDEQTVIDIPADPLAVSGTLTARANVHTTADIATGLTVATQEAQGPYNARGLGEIEQAQVLLGAAGEGVPLLSAAVVRAEAVAVCAGGAATYSANSEIVDLDIGGEDVPLNAPVSDLIDAISGILTNSGLNAVVDVQRNVVTPREGGGVAVDALVVTVLAAAGEAPLGQVRLAHGEVGPITCETPPQCSDTADNDGDGVADAQDPGCHTDGNAGNPDSYDPNDDDEQDQPAPAPAGRLPRTGAATTTAAAVGLLGAALAAVALRRRLTP